MCLVYFHMCLVANFPHLLKSPLAIIADYILKVFKKEQQHMMCVCSTWTHFQD